MQSKLKWWFCLVSVLAAPFAFTVLTYMLGEAMPGTINRTEWEAAASIAFIGAAIAVAMLLDRSTLSSWPRAVIFCIAVLALVISAWLIQMHNGCGPTETYIGQTDQAWRDSECGD